MLDRWAPKTGCFREGAYNKEPWVRILRLPLFFWSRGFFKQLSNAWGVFWGWMTMGGTCNGQEY